MNKLQALLARKKKNILNIYFTAGYPERDDTVKIIQALDKAGADIIELGIPYSDPLADGPTIQMSSKKALENGISLDIIFNQLSDVCKSIHTPVILMGYFNQFLQYGVEKLLQKMKACGIAGIIIPDLPPDYYVRNYKSLFDQYDIGISFLITPASTTARILKADSLSSAFLYMVAQSSITGQSSDPAKKRIEYFNRINEMDLKSKRLIGFGIQDNRDFELACQWADGAIVGSAFIRQLKEGGISSIEEYINRLKGRSTHQIH